MSVQTVGFVQNQFTKKLSEIDKDRGQANNQKFWRKCLALSLKAIAIFGGIAITAGVSEKVAQGIGIAISVAIGLDLLLYNNKSLIAYAQAVNAYDALRKRAERQYEDELPTILTARDNEDQEAPLKYIDLVRGILKYCNEELTKIEEALRRQNIEALKVLEVENKGKTQ